MTSVTQPSSPPSHDIHTFSPVLVPSACSNSYSLTLYAPSPKQPTKSQGITTRLLTGWQGARSGLARLGSGSHSSPVINQLAEEEEQVDHAKASFESDDSAISEFQSIFRKFNDQDKRDSQDLISSSLELCQSLSLDDAPLSPILRTSNPLPYDQSFKSRYQDLIDDVDQSTKEYKPVFNRRHTTSSVN